MDNLQERIEETLNQLSNKFDMFEGLIKVRCFEPDTCSQLIRDMADRIEELEAQLPENMKHCTIIFKECEVGHGELTATNWVQHDCQICEIRKLESENAKLREGINQQTKGGE